MVVMFWVLLGLGMAGGYLLGSGVERNRTRRNVDTGGRPPLPVGVPSWHPEA